MKPQWVTGVELGKHLGIKKARVSQLKKAGVLRVGLNKKFDLDESIKNFKDSKSNAPRLDQSPGLPFKAAPAAGSNVTSIKTFQEEATKLKNGEAVGKASNHDQYMGARAMSAKLKVIKDRILVEELQGRLVDKHKLIEAMTIETTKNNAAIKSKLMAIPKRLALAWPNPKERAQQETIANKIMHTVLTELSKLSPADLDDNVMIIHDYDQIIKSMRKKSNTQND